MELHMWSMNDTNLLRRALSRCTALRTLVLVGAAPLRLSDLDKAVNLACLALNFCAGMSVQGLTLMTNLRYGCW